ncbi:MAG: iron ABC transporter permease [Halanaerobiales bacterium]|nr:iron ABC transporter permease [Halanaerobiales bacterium]
MEQKCVINSKISCLVNKRCFNTQYIILIVVGIFVAVLVLYPFLILVAKSFGITIHGGKLTLNAYIKAFKDPQTLAALRNTLYVASGVTILTSVIGGFLAWLVTRTNLLFKKGITLIVFLTFIIPSYIMAVAWIALLGRNGYINRMLMDLFNLKYSPINIYSLTGVIFVMTLHLYPLVFMALSNALKRTEPSLEKAAILSGASRFKALTSVTLSLIMPSIFSIGLLVFNRAMASFGVATLLALPGGKHILTTRIFSALSSLDLSLATAISMILIICSGVVFFVHNLFLQKKQYTVITSSSCSPIPISLGFWRIPITILVFLFLIFTALLPLMTIIISSFLKKWGLDISMHNFTFANYYTILFEEELTIRAFRNSVLFGIVAATIVTVIGSVVSYISNGTALKGNKLLEFWATWPMSIPGTVIAVAAILAWINPPLKLYNTAWIIIVTYIVVCLPLVVKNVSGLIQNMDFTLEKAARISGASWARTYKDITIPIIMPGLKTGWILSFLMVIREIPISVMLYSYGRETIGVLIFNLRSDVGGLETISAIAVILIILTIAGHLGIEKFGRSRLEVSQNNPSRIKKCKEKIWGSNGC